LYGQIGDSFRTARWCSGTDAVAAVMRGELGETLVIQSLARPNGRVQPPSVVATAEKIEFDVNPKTGTIVFTAANYRWDPKDPTPKNLRFTHMIGMVDPAQRSKTLIGASRPGEACFGSPAISPTGDRLLVLVGDFDASAGSLTPKELAIMPVQVEGFKVASPVAKGALFEPTWSPNGKQVAYVKRGPTGKRSIYVANVDGSDERNISGDTGDFGSPKFSPQTK
jgi:Tol biopolymer transport system component